MHIDGSDELRDEYERLRDTQDKAMEASTFAFNKKRTLTNEPRSLMQEINPTMLTSSPSNGKHFAEAKAASGLKRKAERAESSSKSGRPILPTPLTSMSDSWDNEQERLSKLAVREDSYVRPIRLVGGLDVTFTENGGSNSSDLVFSGIGALVVLNWPDMAIVYTDTVELDTKVPYMAGYLGFREAPFAAELFKRLRSSRPELEPQVTLVDGCGVYHHRACGSASQIGIELDICTVGVSKSFLAIDGMQETDYLQTAPLGSTSHRLLQGRSGRVWGTALYSTTSKHPLFVSIGHRISLESAVSLVSASRIHRIPEPIRQADLLSRRMAARKCTRGLE